MLSRPLASLPVAASGLQLGPRGQSQEHGEQSPRLTAYTRSPDFPPREQERDRAKLVQWVREVFVAVPAQKSDPTMTPRERQLYKMSAAEYIAARRERAVTCEEYAVALVKRARYYRYLNQWIYTCYGRFERMIQQARALDAQAEAQGIEAIGPLYGLPIPMKGTAAVVDYPSGAGVGVLSGYVPKKDSELTLRIQAANGLIFGCTNVPEFAASYTTTNPASGTTRNVYGHHLTVGGSSGGSASAVAAYMCPLAITEDTGGSTRVPALCNQNFGFDPSRNHYCNEGNPGMSYTNDQLGLNAREFEDILLYDLAMMPDLTQTHAAAHVRASLRSSASISIAAPLLPFVHQFAAPGLSEEAGHRTINSDVRERYEAVKMALGSAGFTVLDREWPKAYFDYLGRMENICLECCYTQRLVNGKPVSHGHAGMRSFSGQVAEFVLTYLDAPVSLKEIQEDVTCFEGNPRGPWRLAHMDETSFRYWMGPKIKADCEVYNTLFDETGADFLLIPASNCATPDLESVLASAVPLTYLPGSQFGEGVKCNGNDYQAFGLHNFKFKHLHIPKLVVPTGLTSDGRPTAVEIWGRAVPYELMFDDAYAARHDAEFLQLVRRLVDTIQAQPGLQRRDAEMMINDLHLNRSNYEHLNEQPNSRL